MKVKMRTTMAGPKGVFQAGEIVDLPRAEAYALCEGRFAEQVAGDDAAPESAAIAPPENTARPRARPRG